MVSGLVTSPWDQLRIFSGDAREMRIESKSAIKFARSYGEDLKIASSFYKPSTRRRGDAEENMEWVLRVFPGVSAAPRRIMSVRRQRHIRRLMRLLHQLH